MIVQKSVAPIVVASLALLLVSRQTPGSAVVFLKLNFVIRYNFDNNIKFMTKLFATLCQLADGLDMAEGALLLRGDIALAQ